MNFGGDFRLRAPREQVWAALHDPATLAACIPGCEVVRRTADGAYEGRMRAEVGSLRALFSGRLSVTSETPPAAGILKARADGGAAGSAGGEATLSLSPELGGGTLVSYRARLDLSGPLAQMGERHLLDASRRLAAEFFRRLDQRLAIAPADLPVDLAEPVPGPLAAGGIAAIAPAALGPAHTMGGGAPTAHEMASMLPTQTTPGPVSRPVLQFIGLAVWLAIVLLLFWPRAS